MKTRVLAVMAASILGACAGEQGAPGPDGRSTVLRTSPEPSGAHCASGGLRVDSGVDGDADGLLDEAEVDGTAYVCTGADGTSVTPAPEDPGASCPEGGVRLSAGGGSPVFVCHGETGAAGESVVATSEPAGPSCEHGGQRLQVGSGEPVYVCDGATGAAGESVAMTPEPAGTSCAYGGQRLQVGTGTPTYVCDGAPGADGESVAVTAEPAGASCAYGGQRLQVGSGAPTYVCDGAPGETGPAGESVAVTPEPAGASCPYGGQRLQVGAAAPTYVCDGAPGADGESVSVTPEPAGANCTYGGQRLQVGTGDPTYVCGGAPGAAGDSVTMTPEAPGSNCAFGGVSLRVGAGPVSYLCSGAPPSVTLPTVQTALVTDVRYVAAGVDATVTDDGGELVLLRGVVLADHASPTVRDVVYLSGNGAGAYSTLCDGLEPETTYFVRAFATNVLGTSYGEERSFTTRALTVPTLATRDASNVTSATALAGGDVSDDGGSPLLARGLCWSLAADPTLAGACAHEGPGAGSFLALATGLAPSTTYHLRAYAANAQGTSYGDDRTFTTAQDPLATVTTAAASGVGQTTATAGGNVVSDNGTPVTSRGVCWGTASGPTTAGSKYVEPGGTGSFTAPVTGLATGTTYYLRAFAMSAAGTSYGNEVSFTTLAPSLPSISTKAVTGVSSYLAGSGGTISSDGGSPISAKGVCWSVNPSPTTANATTNDGSGPASYNSTLTGLNPLTTYYVRAYATNGLGTAYGSQVSFTTTDLVSAGPTVPTVGTSSAAMSTSSTATTGGYVSNDGGSAVTARGVCWSTAQNPTLADTCSSDGAGEGFFTSTVTGLGGCGIVYYVRAYATNATGTGYGGQATVSTGLLPAVTTAAATDIGYYGATSGGTIVDDGGCPITQKGVVWHWNPDPTLSSPSTAEGTGSAPFVSTLTGLDPNRTFYVRAYATNSVGTVYGQQEAFATAEPPTPYVGQSYAGGTVFYVDGTGQHGLVVAATDFGWVRWGCPGVSVPTGTAVGTGAANTASIVASCGEAGIAARLADDAVLNGYDDWFLPSIDELSLVYSRLIQRELGGIPAGWYRCWSSSQTEPRYAATLSAWDGGMGWGYKDSGDMMRVVRAF